MLYLQLYTMFSPHNIIWKVCRHTRWKALPAPCWIPDHFYNNCKPLPAHSLHSSILPAHTVRHEYRNVLFHLSYDCPLFYHYKTLLLPLSHLTVRCRDIHRIEIPRYFYCPWTASPKFCKQTLCPRFTCIRNTPHSCSAHYTRKKVLDRKTSVKDE